MIVNWALSTKEIVLGEIKPSEEVIWNEHNNPTKKIIVLHGILFPTSGLPVRIRNLD